MRSGLIRYLDFCEWQVTKAKTIEYLNIIQAKYSQCTYRKRILQIRRFLRYFKLDYLDQIRIVKEPNYEPMRVTKKDFESLIKYLSKWEKSTYQFKSFAYLGFSTGMRPSELFRLTLDDIDLSQRKIHIRKSKTGKARIVFFNNQAKRYLKSYIDEFQQSKQLKHLFGEYHISNHFKDAPIKAKHLRKFFSQEWTRRGGNHIALEQLLGHSIRKSVTMQHYALLSEKELKQSYDRVMNIKRKI